MRQPLEPCANKAENIKRNIVPDARSPLSDTSARQEPAWSEVPPTHSPSTNKPPTMAGMATIWRSSKPPPAQHTSSTNRKTSRLLSNSSNPLTHSQKRKAKSEAQQSIVRIMNSLAQLGTEDVRELRQQIKEQAESILRQSDSGKRRMKENGKANATRTQGRFVTFTVTRSARRWP